MRESLPKKTTTIILCILLLIVFRLHKIFEAHSTLQHSLFGSDNVVTKASDNVVTKAFNGSFFNPTTNKMFYLPTDMNYIANKLKPEDMDWGNGAGLALGFLRSEFAISSRGKLGNCGTSMEVVAWLMEKMNKKNGILMLTYGSLLYFRREQDFINNKTGQYFDDDFDFLAPIESMELLSQLEPELFSQFGFSMRFFVNRVGYVVLAQIFASCGLKGFGAGKIQSSEPGIEIYPIAPKDSNGTLVDLWSGNEFPNTMIYPPQHIQFTTKDTKVMFNLQLPNQDLGILRCLYGNWKVPSSQKGGAANKC